MVVADDEYWRTSLVRLSLSLKSRRERERVEAITMTEDCLAYWYAYKSLDHIRKKMFAIVIIAILHIVYNYYNYNS